MVPLILLLCSIGAADEKPRTAVDYTPLFDEIVGLVEEHFLDPGALEQEFAPVLGAYRGRLPDLSSDGEFTLLVRELLGRLNTSHTAYYTPADRRYYLLAALFRDQPGFRDAFKDQAVRLPSLGLITREIEGKVFAAAVLDGGPADRAGVLKGDEILGLDGAPYSPVDALTGKAGKKALLAIRRRAGAEPRTLELSPVMVDPLEEYLRAQEASVKVLTVRGFKIGYVHLWCYAGGQYHQAFLEALTGGVLEEADALIWDLRDGPGGADPDYLNVFNPKVPLLEARGRDGRTTRLDRQWRKPVAMLVNRGVRCGKEILAFGFRKFGIGKVIGERTAGAVAGGRPFLLSNKAILFIAVNKILVGGEVLEGKGVAPDVEMPMDLRYMEGRDLQVKSAAEHLAGLLEKKERP